MIDFLDNLPFITVVRYFEEEYVGIAGDSDSISTSFYPFLENMNENQKKLFVEYGNIWWWETNRKIPISISLNRQWKIFSPFVKNFITKDLQYVAGREIPSIEKTMIKKTKRRVITVS